LLLCSLAADSAGVIVKVELDVVQVLDFKGTGAK
jgi:hypothetical protein